MTIGPNLYYDNGAASGGGGQCTVEVQTGSTLTDLYQSFVAADQPHAFFTALGLVALAIIVSMLISSLMNRFYRTIMVVIRGWPPTHLDADGDAVEQDEDE